MSVFGGKLTTYRKLAEHALEKLTPYYTGIGPASDQKLRSAGAGRSLAIVMILRPSCVAATPLSASHWRATSPAHTAATAILFSRMPALLKTSGEHFGHELYEAELRYWLNMNGLSAPDDAIWRRTKLGMWLNAEEQSRVAQWLAHHQKDELSLAS